jgi:hypothetical protein
MTCLYCEAPASIVKVKNGAVLAVTCTAHRHEH